ncbi:hypothetical protein EYF80_019983 [Liparis tanakae]|uniref:Uncharacterized protein n=1 Tax=Liparis tanakae TaxID=230148 RepID=A0A4Z2HVY6_9TELE|nr:hypothetical protein EYF80_019983 [Liparis tanakae]
MVAPWQYLGCIGRHLGSLGIVSRCKEGVELAGKQLLSTGKVVADRHAEGQVWVLEHIGFMMALSAEIGLRIGLLGSAISMMTTWACSPTFSLMQMNLSDSMVRVLNPMLAGLMPRFWS